jgi:cytoskeletal protein RodZ
MESLGQYLRHERELRQMSLEEIALTTRIPLRTLQHIEDGQLTALPGEVFVRGFLKSYAKSVGLSTDDVLARYGQRHKDEQAAPAPITAITPPERGRRFGIAIALVVLLILFTLALSIVLRPRQRDTPLELSHASQVIEPGAHA